jgi:hypothetical protein
LLVADGALLAACSSAVQPGDVVGAGDGVAAAVCDDWSAAALAVVPDDC